MGSLESIKSTAAGVLAVVMALLLLAGSAGAASDVLYAGSLSGESLSVIDTSVNQAMISVEVPSPGDLAANADGSKIYIVDKGNNRINTMDTTWSSVGPYFDVSSPDDVVASIDGSEIFIASSLNGRVTAMYTNDTSGDLMSVASPAAEVLAVSPDGAALYVASASNNTVSRIDLATDGAVLLTGIISPDSLVVGKDSSVVYVGSSANGTVSAIDCSTGATIFSVETSSPEDLCLSPDGAKLYVANSGAGTVSVIDTATRSIDSTIIVGSGPCSLAISSDGAKLYVANGGNSTISVIDLSSATVSATISLASAPSTLLVAPAPSDVPFRLRPNGYWFANFYGSELTATDFTNTYGSYDLSDPDSKVTRFYEDFFRYSATNGTCFGMTASALPLYNQRLGIWGYDRDGAVPENWTWVVSIPDSYPTATVQDWIEYYQPLQYDKACIADLATYNDLHANYDVLKQRLASDWRSQPMLLGFSCKVWDDDTNTWMDRGHTVVPYEIQESEDGKTAKMLVWDPNHPYGAINGTDAYQYMTIHLDSWTIDPYDGRFNISNVQLISLDAINAAPQLPDDVISLTGEFNSSHLLFTGDTGGYLGEIKGIAQNSISGASPIISYGATGDGRSIEAYYVPSILNVKKELIGDADGIATVSIYEPNGLVTIDVGVSAGSSGQFEVLDGGSGVQYASSGATPSLSLTVSSGGADSGQVIGVDVSSVEAGESISLAEIDGTMQIVNNGEPKTCTLYLRQTGTDPSEAGGIVVEVEADTTIIAQPDSWSDISQGIVIEHDVGSDGSVDSSETYDPTASLMINDFSVDISSGSAPLTVELTADASGNVDKYKWTFGPSSTEITDTATISHTFKKPGTYAVTLSVKDKDGHESAEMTKEAYVVVT